MNPETIPAIEMQLGDIVNAFPGSPEGYETATVIKLTDDYAYLYRPYVHTSDVIYSGPSLIAYLGHETYPVARDARTVVRYRKGGPLR